MYELENEIKDIKNLLKSCIKWEVQEFQIGAGWSVDNVFDTKQLAINRAKELVYKYNYELDDVKITPVFNAKSMAMWDIEEEEREMDE